MSFKVTFEFPTFETRAAFIGWMSDGGGEQGFYETCEIQDEPCILFDGYDVEDPDEEVFVKAEVIEKEED